MAKRAQQLEASFERMRHLGRRMTVLFLVLTILTLAVAVFAGVLVVRMAMEAGSGDLGWYADATQSVSIPAALFTFAVVVSVELIILGISTDMARGVSPFTRKNSRRIFVLGVLFLVNAAVAMITSPGFISMTFGALRLIDSSASLFGGAAVLPIDMGALFGALVSFSLSAIWRYGALLQEQTEDLV